MKKIIFALICIICFGCSKEDDNRLVNRKSKQQIFNAIIGTWKFSRMAYDPAFKNIKTVEAEECWYDSYVYLSSDGTVSRYRGCAKNFDNGTFSLIKNGFHNGDDNIYIDTQQSGLPLKPGGGGIPIAMIYDFTPNTLVLYFYYDANTLVYSEMVRVD